MGVLGVCGCKDRNWETRSINLSFSQFRWLAVQGSSCELLSEPLGYLTSQLRAHSCSLGRGTLERLSCVPN